MQKVVFRTEFRDRNSGVNTRTKDQERQELNAQIEQWLGAGNKIEAVASNATGWKYELNTHDRSSK